MRILVIAAHPDDEILGCGATTAKHATEGHDVRVLILGEGVTSRKGDEHATAKLSELMNDAKKANAIVGVTDIHFANLPDNKFDSVPLLDIVHAIEAMADEFKPELVYTHHHGDVNVDHRLTADAVQAAFRPMQGGSVVAVHAFEIASSTEWNFRRENPFRPNVFVDISAGHLDKKIAALEAYESEIRDFPHPRSSEYLAALAKVRGGQSGMMAAEAFELVYQKRS